MPVFPHGKHTDTDVTHLYREKGALSFSNIGIRVTDVLDTVVSDFASGGVPALLGRKLHPLHLHRRLNI